MTIVIAHVMFNVCYVVVTIKARLEGMDTHIEEAAADLGANEWTTFRLVTLPLIAPGRRRRRAARVRALVRRLRDHELQRGADATFPLFIWGAARQGVPPQVNVLATALLLIVLVFMFVNMRAQSRRSAKAAAADKEEADPVVDAAPAAALVR